LQVAAPPTIDVSPAAPNEQCRFGRRQDEGNRDRLAQPGGDVILISWTVVLSMLQTKVTTMESSERFQSTLAACSILALAWTSGGVAANCVETGAISCLGSYYSTLPGGIPPNFSCTGGPGYSCLPLERDVNYNGPVIVPSGWHSLNLVGTSKTAQFKAPIGCLYDVGSGHYTCVYPDPWTSVVCYDYTNPPPPRNCP